MHPGDLVFIFRSPAYSSPTAQEGVDALLAAAIFDQKITVIFMGDGVFQLLRNQAPSNGKNQMKMLQSLSMYDIEQIYIQSSALEARALSQADLALPGTCISDDAIHQLMSTAAHVLSF
ncbi:MAG: sulfurtransferase complex subunit TusC [Cellvibrionaceae bacterium]|nr:sulfurtransferase complex subunit TusC [Cellvibrionaceae bacterium]